MKVAIIEDEAPARAALRRALERVAPEVSVVAELASLEETERWLRTLPRIDLVLSDIRLSDGSIFTLFSDVEPPSPVIFVTAHDGYVLDAYRAAGIGYLLKPFSDDDLAATLAGFARLVRHIGEGSLRALSETATSERPRRRLLVRRGRELRAVPVERVAWFRAEDKLSILVERDGREGVVDASLHALERELDPSLFFRVNRGMLVHIDAISSFRSAGKGRITITLSPASATEVVVSAENAPAFRAFVDR